ncbi:septum site-determining protein MinC [Salisediminibacterium beveridgei]|uniref:Probable septum site-determining protein MinC n=1 Tax=Salisediminibacterium beveridgei TaxID=632773 RepID=A0A1D7QTL5_9BACI|nr:septum site-determining protein MinC [Salisediminibacterium beveridgei]AOM82366.1 Septum site-determining protein MinC [Salisediminibacterium beveridgei]
MSDGISDVELVSLRGTKGGLSIQLDDGADWEKVVGRLQEILQDQPANHSPLSASLVLGKRYVTERELNRLKAMMEKQHNIIIRDVEKEVITIEEAKSMVEEQAFHQEVRMVRSGQVLDFKGSVLLVGDVNPGGVIRASGNIYILGHLRGIAHAGASGNPSAVICAAVMEPRQLRIATSIYRSPEAMEALEEQENDDQQPVNDGHLECAYLNENNEMTVERIQKIPKAIIQTDTAIHFNR